jgi:hypothetical protein
MESIAKERQLVPRETHDGSGDYVYRDWVGSGED